MTSELGISLLVPFSPPHARNSTGAVASNSVRHVHAWTQDVQAALTKNAQESECGHESVLFSRQASDVLGQLHPANQGVPVVIDANYAIVHNKILAIDGEVVITGSFNFTKAAQQTNAENLLILRDPALAAQYIQNWDTHRQHGQPYVGRGVRQE